MAHTRTVDKTARIIEQCARGRFIRNVATADFSFATSRSGLVVGASPIADVIKNESGSLKFLFTAPSDGKIESVYVAAHPYFPVTLSGGEVRLTLYRGTTSLITTSSALKDTDGMVIGGHNVSGFTYILSGQYTALSSGVVYDTYFKSGASATFSAGDVIYAKAYMSNHNLLSGNEISVVNVNTEWIPTDKSYASS